MPTRAARLVPFVVALFFVWGFATVLNDTLIPKLKALFELSYAEIMLTQFCFFIGYFVFSLPAGALLTRLGYLRSIVVGLIVMAAGCLLFSPAAAMGAYAMFLVALFVVAAGITVLQVAANPLIAVLGSSASAHSRVTLAQAFNSLGTFVGPWVGAALLLSHGLVTPDSAHLSAAALAALRRSEAQSVQSLFIGMALVLVVLAGLFWIKRRADVGATESPARSRYSTWRVMRAHPRLALGAVSIFVYVGAEVSIGSLLVNYLLLPKNIAATGALGARVSGAAALLGIDTGFVSTAALAGRLVSLYWGGAMLGRFVGSAVLRTVPAGAVLCVCAIAACLFACVSAGSSGTPAIVMVITIGLCNSIMFPTIFTLAIENLGDKIERGAAILCMAIVGGAILPVITGALADAVGLSAALLVPAACYVWIALYGLLARTRLHVR
jgi:FHS family L-fucose permease-like MFS transporter